VQLQPEPVQDRRHQLAGLLGVLAGGAEDHQVICILHQLPEPVPAARPCFIEHVQGDVGDPGYSCVAEGVVRILGYRRRTIVWRMCGFRA
jgi:hypothetical protein